MSHFNPGPQHSQFIPFSDNRTRYEGLKNSFKTDLLAGEFCMKKCDISFSTRDVQEGEKECLR